MRGEGNLKAVNIYHVINEADGVKITNEINGVDVVKFG